MYCRAFDCESVCSESEFEVIILTLFDLGGVRSLTDYTMSSRGGGHHLHVQCATAQPVVIHRFEHSPLHYCVNDLLLIQSLYATLY